MTNDRPIPLIAYEDRALRVPAGQRVETGYVRMDAVTLANRERMSVGDVEAAYRKLLALDGDQAWPPPNGRWVGERFHIHDGRHAYVAALMLGYEYLLAAWTVPA